MIITRVLICVVLETQSKLFLDGGAVWFCCFLSYYVTYSQATTYIFDKAEILL